ncbi:MAG: hypothetical protein WEB30_13680 [Cyclobacteriaceae bacterium]
MKQLRYIFSFVLLLAACEQEVIELQAPEPPPPDPCETASAGSADFSKFVAMGSSYTAGFQAGALFTAGQNTSLAKILATQFACAGGGGFNQPDIGSENGFNIFVTPNPIIAGQNITTLGRFRLQGTPPTPTPVLAGNEAIPNPSLNPSFMYMGNTGALNNFAVQATFLGQILTPAAGDWTNPNPAVGFTPFYARFASDPGSSTILGDAVTAAPSFFLFWVGMDDYLLHAAFGGDPTKAPLTPIEGGVGTGFTQTYNYAIATILGSNANLEGVIANFPSVFALPHFTAVPYNPIPMVEAQASAANSGFAGYNQILEALKGPPFNYPAPEVDARKISFTAGANPFVIVDETLNDYGDEFDGLQGAGAITAEQRAALVPYEQVRQTKAGDIIPLGAGSVLGTLADPANPASVRGVGVPLADQYALIPSEIAAIEAARLGYNAAISDVAANYSTRLALADVNAAVNTFLTNKVFVSDNVTATPNINPPTGIYSEDGMHPNSRGYAFIANIFIDAINAKFGATVPKANLGKYGATGLPIP